jgi:hypothetical protein
LSAVYDLPALGNDGVLRAVTQNWHLSTIFQIQSGFH